MRGKTAQMKAILGKTFLANACRIPPPGRHWLRAF